MEDAIKLRTNHRFLTSAQDVKAIVQSLRVFNISHFSFLRNYRDGSQVYLSDIAQWIIDYYELKLYKSSLFELNPDLYKTGFIQWPKETNREVFLHGKQYYNNHHGITYCDKNTDYVDFYFFSSGNENPEIANFYINNLDILENFILFFKEKCKTIITKAEESKIILPEHYAFFTREQESFLNNYLNLQDLYNNKEAYIQQIKRYVTKQKIDGFVKLTYRESDYVPHLLQGKTTSEIAKTLNVSTRTAESYIDNIKDKLGCKTKLEVILKLNNL